MYLQITTRCNMTCAHCCYSCAPGKGKHGEYNTIIAAIAYAREQGEESISIGGGEPTLHPRFFDILRHCLNDFDYVWLATNGSNTKAMYRLHNIIQGCDYESFEREDYCTCEETEECTCEPSGIIYQEDKLSVALSQDHFHERDKVSQRIVDLWTRQANQHRHSHYEVRNLNNNVAGQGRAAKTGSGWGEHCVCEDFILRPDGKIKLCGCTHSPIIGDVWHGVAAKWQDKIDSDKFQDSRCYQALKRR